MLMSSKTIMMKSWMMLQGLLAKMLPKVWNHWSIIIQEFDAPPESEMPLDNGGQIHLSSLRALSRKRSVKQSTVTTLHNGNLQCPQNSSRS
jgi:hypothetical protein